jgi:hypothetical protein
MTPARTLVIIERAHRGTLEEQYAHVLWLVRTLRRLSALTLLLQGTAAVYALDRPADEARPAERACGLTDDTRATMLSLAEEGTGLLVAATSLRELGLGECPLLPGVRALSDREVAAQWAAHDRIWFL